MRDKKTGTVKLNLLKAALCRTPVFSPTDQLESKWDELKELISLSSPSFYQLIANQTVADLETLSPKVRYTIWKYFNRAKFRPTPFGKYAAISVVPFSATPETPLILEDALSVREFTDWKEARQRSIHKNANLAKARWFIANSTIYTIDTHIRYIRKEGDFFELATVTGFTELNTVLYSCREKISRDALFTKMSTELKMTDREIKRLLSQMLTLQLLFTEFELNITGEEYFKRIGLKTNTSTLRYILTQRKLISGAISEQDMSEIPQLIRFLAKHLPDAEHNTLTSFRTAFLKKFENRTVPIMVALDLELGVGYGDLGNFKATQELAELLDISGASEKKKPQHIPYTALHRFLITRLMNGGPIRLEELTDAQEISDLPLPNTFSVLLHFYGKQPVIENIGGCTANTLLGRFTIASPEVETFARQIADIEASANPDILFFDVAYHMEKEVDNVNRRKQLYPFELPLMSWSCDGQPLFADDILVTVRGSEIILWSHKHNKRMVPRIPSAYNYSRSDLALFRFLCDLQHQHIKSDLNFELSYIFPQLEYYPRVFFKNVIVSPARWKIPGELINSLQPENKKSALELLKNWFNQKGINDAFTAGHSDQKLCFHPAADTDIDAFLSYCRQYGHQPIYISEALISDYDVVTNGSGKKHIAQFVACYGHEQPVYELPELRLQISNPEITSIIPPGNDWLYFEIYCHPVRANEILINKIKPLLTRIKLQIRQWFFIRYNDPRPHIRLRLQLLNIPDGYEIMGKLKSLMHPYLKTGIISDIQVKTYFRETWRYGENRMELTEHLFFQDSRYVVGLLAANKDVENLYALTLMTMSLLIDLVLKGSQDKLNFAKAIADNFLHELSMDRTSFKLLNQKFETLNRDHLTDSNIVGFKLPLQLYKAYSALFRKSKDLNDTRKLLADVLHMHINRLFTSDQRMHEGILYQYLVKLILRQHLRSRAPVEC